jgi:hypothetical protein
MRAPTAPLRLTAVLLLSALSSLASPAAAGPLAEATRGVDNKVETHQESSPQPSAPDSPQHDPRPDPIIYDPVCTGCTHASYVGGTYSGDDDDGMTILRGPLRLDLYLGGHSVVGSQGAVVGDIRLSQSWFGLSASGSGYFEELEGKRGDESIRMDMMAFALNLRLLGIGPTELWLDGGMGVARSSEFETIIGTVFGLYGEHRVLPQLAATARGRFFNLEYDVSAFEGFVGARAWIVSLGYRYLRFNVGPPLHGPEAGLSLRF